MCDSIHFNFTKVYALKSYVGHCALIYQNIGHKNLTFNTRPAYVGHLIPLHLLLIIAHNLML